MSIPLEGKRDIIETYVYIELPDGTLVLMGRKKRIAVYKSKPYLGHICEDGRPVKLKGDKWVYVAQ